MTHAYQESYLSSAMNNLGQAFDYAIRTLGIDGNDFVRMFAASSVAQRLENGEPSHLIGRSGVELAVEVLEEATGKEPRIDLTDAYGRTWEHWCGWTVCYYQWLTALSYQRIFQMISCDELKALYEPYHEADVSKTAEILHGFCQGKSPETNLQRIRKNYGLSQRQLAEASGVSLRSIQMYEQRNKDINKGQSQTLSNLARILGCRIEDLLEPTYPE